MIKKNFLLFILILNFKLDFYKTLNYKTLKLKKNNRFIFNYHCIQEDTYKFNNIKRYFSIHNDTNLIESKNIEICKQIFLDEHNILKNIITTYENNAKVYNELFNLVTTYNENELEEFERYHSGKLEVYKYLMSIGLPLFGKKQRFLQAIIEVLNEEENKNKPISECGIHTQLYYNYINNVLAKNINNYLNEIFVKYKYLLVLPEKTDVKDINILNINFVLVPSKNSRLEKNLEKKDHLLRVPTIGLGLDSTALLHFDAKDSNIISFVCKIEINGKNRIFFFDERISSETPWFLNNEQLASLNFDDNISEEVFKILTAYMEIFVDELACFLVALRSYKCFKNNEDGYNHCLYYFKLAKFLKDNKFISIEEFEKSFDFQIQFILDYLYLEKLSPILATNFCKYLVEEVDLLIKKQGLYDLLLTYIENYPNVIKQKITSKEIFNRISFLFREKFNYKQFDVLKLIDFNNNNVRLHKFAIIAVHIRYMVCQDLENFLAALFPRNNNLVEALNIDKINKKFINIKVYNVKDIEKVRADLNNDLIPKIFLHEENIRLFLDSFIYHSFIYLDLESFFQENFGSIYLNLNYLKENNTYFPLNNYKRLIGQIHLYLELYQEIVNKVKQKKDFVDDQQNLELNQYFKDVCIYLLNNIKLYYINGYINGNNKINIFVYGDKNDPLQISLNENIKLYLDFLRMVKKYSLLETSEEKEKSFLEIQKFVHSLPKTNIIVSLFKIYDL